MHRSLRIVFTAVAAIMILALAVGPAAARTRIEVSTTAVLMSAGLTFELPLALLICDVTVHITLRRLINKVRLEQAGNITSVSTANARNSLGLEAGCAFLFAMSFHYGSINGTLPVIGGLEFLWMLTLLERIGSTECLYRGLVRAESTENPMRVARISAEPRVLEVRVLRDEFFRPCSGEGAIRGSMTTSPALTVRLLER